jgi:hypothetical protein
MLVIVAIALTALIAMTGLVIDGGIAWSNRRQAQNAADSAALAGTRVLGLDLKWRAAGASGTPPFAAADAAVCDAINVALAYNENTGQDIDQIDCISGSPDAVYVNFDRLDVGQVGDGIPITAQGVRVQAQGNSATLLMSVVSIDSIKVETEAVALAGPAEPPLGKLMPFVVQNPLGAFVPGTPYEIRSESEGECGASAPTDTMVADALDDAGIVLAVYNPADPEHQVYAAPPPAKPLTPVADPLSQSFLADISVELSSPTGGAKIHYTTDGTTPSAASEEYKNTPLVFTETTVLNAIATKGGETSDVGAFTYTKAGPPPDAVIATPDSQTFDPSITVSLTTNPSDAMIHFTTDGSQPTSASPMYSSALTLTTSTVIKAVAIKNLSSSPVATFYYNLAGETAAVTANPVDGTEFESGVSVSLSTATSGATIHYTLNGTEPTSSSPTYSSAIVLTATTTIRAFATADGSDSPESSFTYTKVGPTCPDSTAGNFGWVDFSGGAGGNNELKQWVDDPSTAPTDWYYTLCSGSETKNCRDEHNVDDPADDHWRLEGTTGHRDVTLDIACKYVDEEIYVPIWDGFETISKKANGANAVFHLIGFAVFKLEGVIDTKPDGSPSGKGCGVQDIDGETKKKDKGFIGTYVDSFIGSQVTACVVDGTNPCANLGANTSFTINLAK